MVLPGWIGLGSETGVTCVSGCYITLEESAILASREDDQAGLLCRLFHHNDAVANDVAQLLHDARRPVDFDQIR